MQLLPNDQMNFQLICISSYLANGDSGFCTSPRPESTQSTISNTNGHRNASKEESLCSKKEEDFQEERVPCEFCGELRIRETIMRHQVIFISSKSLQ